jgi:DNA-binding NtrC family response regulator
LPGFFLLFRLMAQLLVSWLARSNDFYYEGPNWAYSAVNLEGPTVQFHAHFFAAGGYDEHVILYSEKKQEMLAEHLRTQLLTKHPGRAIRTELLEVLDVIDLAEVKTKVETWLLRHAEHELTIYFSPGTSIMQVAWYICHTTLGLRTQLVQTRAAKHSTDKQPALLRLEVEYSATPMTAVLREAQVAARTQSGPGDSGLRPARRTGKATTGQPDAPARPEAFLLTPSLEKVYRRAGQVAQTDDVTVLVRGESGTGKEHLAQTVHQESSRKNAPFLALNCAALTDSVLESRLFGYQKGAFTGADKDTKGVFEEAEGGTVFLDEIGDISPALQTALLRVLQAREIQPLGGKPRRVNVRVVAATHADLEERCRQGSFRWDLYFRLAVAELELPTLREFPVAEREQLLAYFVAKKQVALRRPVPLQLAAATREQILAYPFPGNVRELENLLETLYVFAEAGQAVQPDDLPRRMRAGGIGRGVSLKLEDVKRLHIVRVVEQCGGVKRQAALLLDIDERVVAKALQEHAALLEAGG